MGNVCGGVAFAAACNRPPQNDAKASVARGSRSLLREDKRCMTSCGRGAVRIGALPSRRQNFSGTSSVSECDCLRTVLDAGELRGPRGPIRRSRARCSQALHVFSRIPGGYRVWLAREIQPVTL